MIIICKNKYIYFILCFDKVDDTKSIFYVEWFDASEELTDETNN